MRLSEREAEIIAAVELQADLTIEEIAEKTRYQEHTVRYHLHQLEERKIIKRKPFINMAAAGYTDVGLYFSPVYDPKFSPESISSFLAEARSVVWLAELSGDYQFGMAFSVESLSEVEPHLVSFAEKYPTLFHEKIVAMQFRATRYQRKYLSRKQAPGEPLVLAGTSSKANLDHIDRRVLSALAYEEYKSMRQLAQILQMPLSTLDDRVKRLEKQKVIEAWVYEADLSSFGIQSYTLLVFAKGLSRPLKAGMEAFARKNPHVTFLYHCLGSWDFELNVEAEHYSQVQEIILSLQANFGQYLNTIKVVTKQREIKYTFAPF